MTTKNPPQRMLLNLIFHRLKIFIQRNTLIHLLLFKKFIYSNYYKYMQNILDIYILIKKR